MAPISPGLQAATARKRVKPAAAKNAHRFEAFSKRIAKLKIDPIHKVSGARHADDHDGWTESRFRASLDHWNEFNSSHNFTQFSTKVAPLCESLPLLLYHADSILELLKEYIGKQDHLSLEPLLSLVTHFAYDVGQEFETHFAGVITLVLSVAASLDAPEALEWSFTCVAWICKFLSRLLIPNLRPLLQILSPFLGTSRQKHYITRFAAEASAFLIRKAAVTYPRQNSQLEIALSFLLSQLDALEHSNDIQRFQTGLMILFSEAARGVNGDIHSSTPDLFRALLDQVPNSRDQASRRTEVIEGFLIGLCHRSDPVALKPIVDVIVQRCSHDPPVLCFHLMTTIIATRKGSKISNWADVMHALLITGESTISRTDVVEDLRRHVLTSVAVAMQYCPMDEMVPFIEPYLRLASAAFRHAGFLKFCRLFNDLGQERFQTILLPSLQNFINLHWRESEDSLTNTLIHLHKLEAINPRAGERGYIYACSEWGNSLIDRNCEAFRRTRDSFGAQLEWMTELLRAIDFPARDNKLHELTECLSQVLVKSLETFGDLDERWRIFALGKGFETYLYLQNRLPGFVDLDETIYWLACKNTTSNMKIAHFVRNLSTYLDALPNTIDFKSGASDSIRTRLTENLASADKDLVEASLELLRRIHGAGDSWMTQVTTLGLGILKATYNLQSVRRIKMEIRQLARLHLGRSLSSPEANIIIYLFFGLLSIFPGQVSKELCATLAETSKDSESEHVIADLAISWLRSEPTGFPTSSIAEHTSDAVTTLTPFLCSNLLEARRLSSSVFGNSTVLNEDPDPKAVQNAGPLKHTPSTSREIALQIFLEAPQIAEKHSRLIVPVFLLSRSSSIARGSLHGVDNSVSPHTQSPDKTEPTWTQIDIVAFLKLLGAFQNPKVLYKSTEVYDSLLDLLTHGNSLIQRLALKAILTWKNPNIVPYEEHLMRLIDGKTHRDELATVCHKDKQQSSIDPCHREQLLPILLRLLFGQCISRSGSHGDQLAKRKAILRTLFRFEDTEVGQFLSIAYESFPRSHRFSQEELSSMFVLAESIGQDQQYGLLKMTESMLETLQGQLSSFGTMIFEPVLQCTIQACQSLIETDDQGSGNINPGKAQLSRSIRKLGIQCINLLFQYCSNTEWTPYLPLIFEHIINPRLHCFATDTAQGIAGLLRLYSTWSSSAKMVSYLQEYNSSLTGAILQCLTVQSAKDEVKVFVLEEIVANITSLASAGSSMGARSVLQANIDILTGQFSELLNLRPSQKILNISVDILSELAEFVESHNGAGSLIMPLLALLSEPAERVKPFTKAKLVRSITQLLSGHQQYLDQAVLHRIYETVVPLFDYFKDATSRPVVAAMMRVLSGGDPSLDKVAKLCTMLNSYSTTRLDDVDFDQQLQAFNEINDLELQSLTASHWKALVYNLHFFARVDGDFAIRSNSVASLKSLILKVAGTGEDGFQVLIEKTVLPALKRAIKDDSETVRADHVALFGMIVKEFPDFKQLNDMRGLLAGGDEEASFFTNVLHIQQHRRTRAIHRLVGEVEAGNVQPSNISGFFLPLLEKFVFDTASDESANNLKGHSILAIKALLGWLEWNQFKAIFRRYKGFLVSKPDHEKDVIKLLGASADALLRATRQKLEQVVPVDAEKNNSPLSCLATTFHSDVKVGEEITTQMIPGLIDFVHRKDESQISLRVPVAVTTVKLLKILPVEIASQFLPSILLDICQILCSRTQESRDTARRTLSEMAVILGPSCVGYVLKELRSTLTRGYQLHVLGYTVHAILVATAPHFVPGDLDYCLSNVVNVIMDDIFGSVGAEKTNEDYVSQMKEVKQSKSFNSMELLAQCTSIRHLTKLIRPIQTILDGSLTSKHMKQVDELLRRIGVGLSQNASAGDRELLVFAYELVKDVYQDNSTPIHMITNDEKNRQRFLVQLTGAAKTRSVSTFSSNYKIVRFALDIVRSMLQKHPSLMTPENVHGFLPIIGDALIQSHDEIKISALRLLSAVIRLPLSELDDNSSLYVTDAVKIVKDSSGADTEIAQAALKLISAILRDRRNATVRETEISYLLHRITPDLEEPDRQGVTFNFVKAVMSRKLMLPAVYEVVDKIGIMMVNNHSRSSQDMARGVYIHFLLEYPQTKSRWSKQIKFLIKNLDYKHPEGRRSVMEAINMLLLKVGTETAHQLIDSCFMPVALLMSNDEDARCRELAGALISRIFHQAADDHRNSLFMSVRSWSAQIANLSLTALGLQISRIYCDTPTMNLETDSKILLTCILEILQSEVVTHDGENWAVIYHALQVFSKLYERISTAQMSTRSSRVWTEIKGLLAHPHPWVQASAAKLVNLWLAECGRHHSASGLASLPLCTAHGLLLEADSMTSILRLSFRVLRRGNADPDLGLYTTSNLVFIGRCVDVNGLSIDIQMPTAREVDEQSDETSSSEHSDVDTSKPKVIPAIDYFFHQAASILRHEPPQLTLVALSPKQSTINLVSALVPHITEVNLRKSLLSIMLPLHHLTDPSIPGPSNPNPTFQTAYQALVASAQELLETIQKKVGSKEYVQWLTDISRTVRGRREGRRTKRRIEKITEPEKAAREKRRKNERKKEMKKERAIEHRGRRRGW